MMTGDRGPEMGFAVREAVTRVDGRRRRGEAAAPPPGQSFQVREAVTVETEDRRPKTGRDSPSPVPGPPSTTFQVREAVTIIQEPPHWAAVRQAAAEIAAKEAQNAHHQE